jgi:hypothetical protein
VGDPAYDAGYWLASAFEPQLREDISVILARHLGLDDERVASWASVAALDC